MADAICQIGVSEVTFYRSREEFGGLKTDQLRRLKELELENSRLRKAVCAPCSRHSCATSSCGVPSRAECFIDSLDRQPIPLDDCFPGWAKPRPSTEMG
jgi:hypothetical protein